MDRLGPHVVYINLARRTDRRKEMEAECSKLGISPLRFEAIDRQPGILGCGLSHLAVLKMAVEMDWPRILILEDDFELLVSPSEFWDTVGRSLQQLGEDWDVLMLAYHIQASTPSDYPDLLRVQCAQTASAYIVNQRFYEELTAHFEKAMPLLQTTGEHWNYANDQTWKWLQPKSRWFATAKRLSKQRASYSDTGGGFANYNI